jgi:acyl carrier protein
VNKDILKKIRTIFINILEKDNFELVGSSKIGDVDGWDSLTHMMIISEIEDKFNIEFELEELWHMKNVGDLVSHINNKI